MMPGVVSLPHGWGHTRPGVRLRVATDRPGVSVNDVTDEQLVDRLTGNVVFNGVPVEVTAIRESDAVRSVDWRSTGRGRWRFRPCGGVTSG